MEINNTLNQNVDTLFQNLESFTQNEGVMGKPVTFGDKTFIPVVSLTFGYGGGNTSGKAGQNATNAASTTQQGNGTGQSGLGMGMGALGLGARLSTDAVILIDKDNVSMMQLSMTGGNMSQLMNQLPQMFMGKGAQQQGQQQQGQQGQQGGQQGQQGQQQ